MIKFPFFNPKPRVESKDYSPEDIEYMSSLSAAVLEQQTSRSHIAVWVACIGILWLIVWSSFAEIDERTRGSGKVIPSQRIQTIQNLEGGIVSEMFVKEGDRVKKGQPLMKIQDVGFTGSFNEKQLKINELKAKSYRLNAEASGQGFSVPTSDHQGMSQLISQEANLHMSQRSQLSNAVSIIDAQISQKGKELLESKAKREELKNAYDLISQEMAITEPLTKNMVVSEVQFLQMKRQAAMIKGDYQATGHTIARIQENIGELRKKRMEIVYEFRNKAKQELNSVTAEIQQIRESESVLADRVDRTIVRSPVNGTINQILINTIGGVVKPGMDMLEIVPEDDMLMVEVKIKPSDIAYIYPGQSANVKFTAYDFSIYGGLKGKVKHVSANTITDEKDNSFYLVRIATDKSFLLKDGKPLDIMAGMTVDVDILTGKKTVMDFILKPILKVKQNALGEH